MIEWQKYDPANPPETGRQYLVSDGWHVDVASIDDYGEVRRYPPDQSSINESSVRHYAEINLPEEDK